MAIYDTMQLISSPIKVVVTGMAASMGSILLCGATMDALPIPAFTCPHSPTADIRAMVAVAVDIHIQAQEMERLRDELNTILANSSGQAIDKIEKDTDRDFYMTADEAIEYRLADAIVALDLSHLTCRMDAKDLSPAEDTQTALEKLSKYSGKVLVLPLPRIIKMGLSCMSIPGLICKQLGWPNR